ncbi:Rpn family recombination-promoting nuclease/putative transposase [Pseudomonas sp. ABC1]|uniref:Rpn family recombination-promoting nuclease/putative transposase n=1 Tax=Pseudomonas sp. ABC1 TaxID=2748080 RepID=UPI0015C36657|nr:Rpn family recombination-promoting nuclease/putative transposase [Pseudomonas sp. ABC1]QLF93768.1 Rpn family recombination-promoting nuclease/putative transposase [Pseudomonas sp. ABC1]
MTALLDPKNDFVFKRLFVGAPEILADLINAVRSAAPPIEVLEILNPNIEPGELHGKFIVLDILARDPQGHRYNIEMQVRRHADYSLRSLYYLARTLGQQLHKGDDYSDLKPVVGIHLMDFESFPEAQAHWHFELRDRLHPHVRIDGLHLHLIELPKADRLGCSLNGALADWVAYFEHWQEESVMQGIQHPPVRQALEELQQLSDDAEARRLAFVRERALRDELSELRAARAEGRETGRDEGRIALLEKQLGLKFGPLPEAIRERLHGAGRDELELWAERVLFVEQMDAVFAEA